MKTVATAPHNGSELAALPPRADRSFIKPASFFVLQRLPDFAEKQVPYSFNDFLAEFVWSYPKWGEEDAWEDAIIRIGEIIEAAAVGEPIALRFEDWEKLREAVKAAKIGGLYAPKARRMARDIKHAA